MMRKQKVFSRHTVVVCGGFFLKFLFFLHFFLGKKTELSGCFLDFPNKKKPKIFQKGMVPSLRLLLLRMIGFFVLGIGDLLGTIVVLVYTNKSSIYVRFIIWCWVWVGCYWVLNGVLYCYLYKRSSRGNFYKECINGIGLVYLIMPFVYMFLPSWTFACAAFCVPVRFNPWVSRELLDWCWDDPDFECMVHEINLVAARVHLNTRYNLYLLPFATIQREAQDILNGKDKRPFRPIIQLFHDLVNEFRATITKLKQPHRNVLLFSELFDTYVVNPVFALGGWVCVFLPLVFFALEHNQSWEWVVYAALRCLGIVCLVLMRRAYHKLNAFWCPVQLDKKHIALIYTAYQHALHQRQISETGQLCLLVASEVANKGSAIGSSVHALLPEIFKFANLTPNRKPLDLSKQVYLLARKCEEIHLLSHSPPC